MSTYKEDFEQERKDQENEQLLKEDEIRKIKIQMQELEAQCQEKVQTVKN